MVPIDLAEHHVTGKDHQFSGRAPLVGDGERLPSGIDAETREQPILIEVTAIGDAGMEAVAGEIVHLVDIDRPGEEGVEEHPGRVGGGPVDEGRDPGWLEPPLRPEDLGGRAGPEDPADERLVAGELRQAHVFEGMAVGPVPDVVHEGGNDERCGVCFTDGGGEVVVAPEPAEEGQRQTVDPQRMLEAGVDGAGVDQRHQPELADPRQAAHLGGVDEGPHPGRQRHCHVGGDADAVGGMLRRNQLWECVVSHREPRWRGSSSGQLRGR